MQGEGPGEFAEGRMRQWFPHPEKCRVAGAKDEETISDSSSPSRFETRPSGAPQHEGRRTGSPTNDRSANARSSRYLPLPLAVAWRGEFFAGAKFQRARCGDVLVESKVALRRCIVVV